MIMAQSEEDLQIRMRKWQESLEARRLHVSATKTVVMISSKTGKKANLDRYYFNAKEI